MSFTTHIEEAKDREPDGDELKARKYDEQILDLEAQLAQTENEEEKF